jgi:hypothetical protein
MGHHSPSFRLYRIFSCLEAILQEIAEDLEFIVSLQIITCITVNDIMSHKGMKKT